MRIYLCPALMDLLVFLVHFAVLYGAGERHLSMMQCAWLGGVFQLTYLSFSLGTGYVLNRRNARTLLLASTALCLGLALICVLGTHFALLLTAMTVYGAATAVFFNAFQTFMRGEAAPGGLAKSVGLYTLAWSLGSSLGFLSSGYFYGLGRLALAAGCVAVAGVILVVLWRHRARPEGELSADEHVEQGSKKARPVNAAYVWVGWLIIFSGMFIQRPIHNFFPTLCAREGISSFAAGVPLSLQMLVQGVVGLICIRYRDFLYRRTPLWLLHVAAAAVLVALWRWPGYAVGVAGIGVIGVYTGFAYFSAVYYASNSGRRSFNIGVNEFLVGVGSFAGLFVSEWWMTRTGNPAVMYLVCAVTLLLSTVLQMAVATVHRTAPGGRR